MFPHAFVRLDEPPSIPARVASQERDAYSVMLAGAAGIQTVRASIAGALRHEAFEAGDLPAVGDYVAVDLDAHGRHAVIRRVLPRRNLFVRRAAGTAPGTQPIAANIDTLFVAVALNRDFNLRRMERYLAGADHCDVPAAIVLTKSDLTDDVASYVSAAASVAGERPIVVVSALEGVGLAAFDAFRGPGKTLAIVGSSGAGKSTLLNALLGETVLDTGAARADDDRGRHTTTRRQLMHLADGTAIVDTPGMREFGLTGGDDVLATFDDVAELATRCRFGDCKHESEPGCGVIEALDAERLASYRKLAREAIFEAGKADHSVRLAEKRRWKSITKSARAFGKRKRGDA